MIPAFIDLDTEWRGGQHQALLLLQGLYEHGHAAELVTSQGAPLGHRAKKLGIYVHTVPRSFSRLRASAMIRRLLADGRIDLLHANEAHALTAAWLAGAHNRVPVLSSRRIAFPLQKNWISQSRYRSVQRFIANSKNVAESLTVAGISSDRISIVNEGVPIPEPISAAERASARKKWRVRDDEFLFGCASAFVPEKGQRHVVEALATVRKDFPNVRLLLAGEGATHHQVQALAAQLGLADVVLLPGFVAHMQTFYVALDAFVFPSEFEGLGTALQSAMAYALPAISTTRGALGEVVEDGRTALVAEPTAESFASAMISLLRDTSLQKRLGEAAREEVRRRFSSELMVQNTLRVYDDVLLGNGGVS